MRGEKFDLIVRRWKSSCAELVQVAAENYRRLALGLPAVPITLCPPGRGCNWRLAWDRDIAARHARQAKHEKRAKTESEKADAHRAKARAASLDAYYRRKAEKAAHRAAIERGEAPPPIEVRKRGRPARPHADPALEARRIARNTRHAAWRKGDQAP